MSHSRDENNSDSESIKSTDSKIGLKFLEYDSDEENSPPLQSQTGEDEPKPEEEGIGDMDQNPSNQEKENKFSFYLHPLLKKWNYIYFKWWTSHRL